MELAQALQILDALADGRDPLTGQPLAAGHLCQQAPVVRALCLAVQELRRREAPPRLSGGATENAGKPWTADEEAELVRAFQAGATLGQLALRHGRTRQAIQGRLYRLGQVPAWRPGARPGQEVPEVEQRGDREFPDGIRPRGGT
jgi:hypothetical protein